MPEKILTLQDLGISVAEEDIAVIPSEGISFGAGSIIAPWTAGIHYWFLTNEDYVIYNSENNEKVPVPDIRKVKGGSGWFDMYYGNYDRALGAYYALQPEAKEKNYKPKCYWVFTAPTASVLNSRDLDKMVQGFGDTLIFGSRVMALRKGSGRYPLGERHEYGLMSLPGAVAAVADAFGFQHVGFGLSEFTEPEAREGMDDEFFVKFCGNTEGGYDGSVLYQRRAALWASLGEDNPKASAIIGSKTASGKPNREATTSEKLSQCLSIVQGKWTKPLYARVMLVPNPMASDDGEHYGLPVLAEIFRDEAAARTAAQEELGDSQPKTSSPPTGGWGSATPREVITYLQENDIIPLSEYHPGSLAVVPPPQKAEQDALRNKLAKESYLGEGEWDLLVAWDAYYGEGYKGNS